ncbi:serpin family protein [Indiicoccus explosivorum]|uniref:serpin family protein n=1 Tax=Indiicoccus explosivorum TaxID=1917864 RepID=UPI000B448647|nr:serpin family protein [Indiicoccus explosivorum]
MRKGLAEFIAIVLLSGCGTAEEPGTSEISERAEFGETDYELIAEANNVLGMKVMGDLTEREEGNIFISPVSLYMALAMVYNGADGVTKTEIGNVLEAEGVSAEDMNRANASLMAALQSDSEDIRLEFANSIWVKDSYSFLDSFTESSRDYYRAEIESIDVTDPESAERINSWVAEATNGKIEDMVSKPLPGNLVALLLNAVYFKGDWQYPFIRELTEEKPFSTAGGTVQVPLMERQAEFPYFETEAFQAVSLPYGKGEMSMEVFLPSENSSLEKFQASLTEEKWDEWMSAFQKKQGTVLLPKFQLEYEKVLNETLQRLGMATAFSSVDLSNMFEDSEGLFISEVKQKTFIDVNETGTEAAAATSVAVAESAPAEPPFILEADRPFFLAITDKETGVILFMGAIENPVN